MNNNARPAVRQELDGNTLLGLDDHLLETILKKAIGAASARRWGGFPLMRICRRFRQALLRLATAARVERNAALLDLSLCSNLQRLHVSYCNALPWQGIGTRQHSVAHLQHFTALECWECGPLRRRDLAEICSFATLQRLVVRRCKFVRSRFGGLRRLTELRHLELVELEENVELEMSQLARLTKLTYLDLTDCGDVTDEGLSHLSGLTDLQHLNLSMCDELQGPGLASLSALAPSLSHLDLSGCPDLEDQSVAHIAELVSLRYLSLQHLSLEDNSKLTDRGLVELSALTALTSLELGGTLLTRAGVRGLSSLVGLVRLDLQHCNLSNEDLQAFSPFTQLTELDLTRSGITSDALTHDDMYRARSYIPFRVRVLHEDFDYEAAAEAIQEQMYFAEHPELFDDDVDDWYFGP